MFDIGISEIAVIAVVALVVIGPERLPKVARTVGTLLGRAQRYVNDVKAEVNREMELEELRKLQTQMQDAARGIQESVSSAGAQVQSAVHDMEKQLNEGVTSPGTADPAATAATAATAPAAASGLPELTEPPDPAAASGLPELTEPPASTAASFEHPVPPPPPAPTAQPVRAPLIAADDASPAVNPAQSSLFPEQTIR